jgi:hypothetical protein
MRGRRILITELAAGVTEAAVREWLGRFGPVVQVRIHREAEVAAPVAFVEMEIGGAEAAQLISQVGCWHAGAAFNVRQVTD